MTDAPTTDRWIRHLNLLQLVLAGIIIMTPTVWMVLSSLVIGKPVGIVHVHDVLRAGVA